MIGAPLARQVADGERDGERDRARVDGEGLRQPDSIDPELGKPRGEDFLRTSGQLVLRDVEREHPAPGLVLRDLLLHHELRELDELPWNTAAAVGEKSS